jgi:hypothetical protein
LFQEKGQTMNYLPTTGFVIGITNHNDGRRPDDRRRHEQSQQLDLLHALTSTLFWYGGGDSETGYKNNSLIDYQSNEYVRSLNSSSLLWRTFSGIGGSGNSSSNRSNNLNLFFRRQYEEEEDPTSDDLNHSKRKKTDPMPRRRIQRIVVLGERHSGTTFVTKYLQSCFNGSTQGDNVHDNHTENRGDIITVTDRFVNTKHWFQPSPEYVVWTVLNDLYLHKQKLNRKEDLNNGNVRSSKITKGEYDMNDCVLPPAKAPLSSDGSNYNDDVDLQWWKEIVLGRAELGGKNAINSSTKTTKMELFRLFNNQTNSTSLFNSLLHATNKFFESTFVFVLVRDPYDW